MDADEYIRYEAQQQIVTDFVRHLADQGFVICEPDVHRGKYESQYIPVITYIPITLHSPNAVANTVAAFWRKREQKREAIKSRGDPNCPYCAGTGCTLCCADIYDAQEEAKYQYRRDMRRDRNHPF